MTTTTAEVEIRAGERFEFGDNWRLFLSVLDDERIAAAEASLVDMLEGMDLTGRRFLDAGSGSGLFSLAARRLGAFVHSFDYDPQSVACTAELKSRYFRNDDDWVVEHGSVLDADYLATLGTFDVVYSWGVLHHTGDMWRALDNVAALVADGGKLFVSIYNDQGYFSECWRDVKRLYCDSSRPVRWMILKAVGALFVVKRAARLVAEREVLPSKLRGPTRRPPAAYRWNRAKSGRGMSASHDLKDWVGGYPFEVAKPEAVFNACRAKGFQLIRLATCRGGLGCNQFVFQKLPIFRDATRENQP
jgi:2-polyprenyl-3-methyl-5-hydroxy-6-metoxy-1,4-benzoquinol methylase